MNSKNYIKQHQLNQPTDLLPLSPHFNEQAHANYVVRLLRAVYEQRDCFNIALAGPYGCGKSSILSEFCSISKRPGIGSCMSVSPPSTLLKYPKRMSSDSLSVKFLDKFSIRVTSIKRLSHLSKGSTATHIFVQSLPHFYLHCLPCCSLLCLYSFPMETQTS